MRIPALIILSLVGSAFAADTTTPAPVAPAPAVGGAPAQHPNPALTPEQREERREKWEESKLKHAEKALDEAIADLKKAPHDFGGHKAEAIAACEKAQAQLKEAIVFEEKNEGAKGEHNEKKKADAAK